eukprot:6192696-Pleurochrysis_carterae.AAC.1
MHANAASAHACKCGERACERACMTCMRRTRVHKHCESTRSTQCTRSAQCTSSGHSELFCTRFLAMQVKHIHLPVQFLASQSDGASPPQSAAQPEDRMCVSIWITEKAMGADQAWLRQGTVSRLLRALMRAILRARARARVCDHRSACEHARKRACSRAARPSAWSTHFFGRA